ncbi:hypothetical protein EON65_40005 [archaeon]|nr:MAG: hypothetical protein EON65_40005 [archaeon]
MKSAFFDSKVTWLSTFFAAMMVPSSSLFNKYNKLLTGSTSTSSSQAASSRKQNKVLEAQKSSGLYDDTKLFADPLNRPKEERRVTLGKEWFDLEVYHHICYSMQFCVFKIVL